MMHDQCTPREADPAEGLHFAYDFAAQCDKDKDADQDDEIHPGRVKRPNKAAQIHT